MRLLPKRIKKIRKEISYSFVDSTKDQMLYFLEPCDSRIVSVFKAARRNSRMKLIPMDCLRSQAILIDEGENTISIMAILHEI